MTRRTEILRYGAGSGSGIVIAGSAGCSVGFSTISSSESTWIVPFGSLMIVSGWVVANAVFRLSSALGPASTSTTVQPFY